MNRSSLILSTLLFLSLGGIGYVVSAAESEPPPLNNPLTQERDDLDPQPVGHKEESQPNSSSATDTPPAQSSERLTTRADDSGANQVAEERSADDNPDEPSQTVGAIRGGIALDVSALPLLRRYRVVVREDINPNSGPYKERKPVTKARNFIYKGGATPTFHFTDVPFSDHGYVVKVLAKGLNGSEQRVHVNKNKPLGETTLSLTPGILFSVKVTDQRRNRLNGLFVHLIPIEPIGDRFALHAKTNGYGVALFESVVAGDYKVFVGQADAPHCRPKKVQVFASNPIQLKAGRVQVQNTTLVVPQGKPIRIEVFDNNGYGVRDAKIDMHQIETNRFFRYEAKTDVSGTHNFAHVPVGTYQLSVSKPGKGRRTMKVYLREKDSLKKVRIKLY